MVACTALIATPLALASAPADDDVDVGLTARASTEIRLNNDAHRTLDAAGAVALGQSAMLKLHARANEFVQAANPPTPVGPAPVAGSDQNNVDRTATDIGSPPPLLLAREKADLQISTTVATDVVQPGEVVACTVTVTNLGPDATSTVEALGPEGFATDILTVDSPSNTSFDLTNRTWTIGSLRAGESTTLVVRERLTAVGTSVHTAKITQSSTPDPNLSNNTDRAVLGAPNADLVVMARSDSAQVEAGTKVIFTIVALNVGPSVAAGVSVIDQLPPELSFVDATVTVGNYDPAAGVWRIGALPPGELQTLRMEALAGSPAVVRSHAVITATSPTEHDNANNSAETTLTIVSTQEVAALGTGSTGSTGGAKLGWWLTSSGVFGLCLVLAGAALILARRRDPLSEI